MARVLVIGVGGGLGGAVAKALIARGDSVLGSVRDASQFDAARAALPAIDDVIALDLYDPPAVRATLLQLMQRAPVDAVINCAALSEYHSLEAVSLERAQQILSVNLVSCLAIYQACLPTLRARGGRLVLVGSLSGKVAFPLLGPYQASKFGLEGLADTMRMEAVASGVKVVLVEPGGIDTRMSRGMRDSIQSALDALPPDEAAIYGGFYRKFIGRLQAGVNSPSPDAVAVTVLQALDAADPEPRYPHGEDTRWLFAKRAELDDRAMDAFLDAV